MQKCCQAGMTVSRLKLVYNGLVRAQLLSLACNDALDDILLVCRLAASATPKSPEHVAAIRSTGIKHVYTLTQEEPLPASFFSLQGPKHTFSPVPDGRAPTFTQVAITFLGSSCKQAMSYAEKLDFSSLQVLDSSISDPSASGTD